MQQNILLRKQKKIAKGRQDLKDVHDSWLAAECSTLHTHICTARDATKQKERNVKVGDYCIYKTKGKLG